MTLSQWLQSLRKHQEDPLNTPTKHCYWDPQFQDPPKKYREVPFWSWNDDLDPLELRRQVALMDEAGWGGVFMH